MYYGQDLGTTAKLVRGWRDDVTRLCGTDEAGAGVVKPYITTLTLDLLADPDALPEHPTNLEAAMTKVSEKALKRKANKSIILKLSSLLVWFVALFFYVILSSFELTEPYRHILFFYAIPANAIVVLSLRSAWRDFRWNKILISIIVWGSLLSLYATLFLFWKVHLWRMFLLGIPGQIAILLWFKLFQPAKEKHPQEESHD